MGNTMKKKDDNVTQLSEYKGFQALQKSVGGLATITDKKLADDYRQICNITITKFYAILMIILIVV